ncbi:unnamed protein product [Rotaria magnacalcarata]
MVSMKCVYDFMFNKIEPSNDNKLKVLNHLINKTTDGNELRKYYSKRVGIFFNMRQWKNVLDDIDHIQQYGELNGAMSILKVKASIQNELPSREHADLNRKLRLDYREVKPLKRLKNSLTII